MLLGVWLMLGVCNLSVLVFHDSLLVPVLMYGSETMIQRGKERSMIRTVQIDNLRGLLGIRRMDKVPNVRIRQICGVMKAVENGERQDC